MAHYAFLDENNIVTEVIVGKDEGEDGVDWEQHYGNFRGQVCKRTSYNSRGGVHYGAQTSSTFTADIIPAPSGKPAFRKNYAGIGFTYDSQRDAFIPPKPFSSWLLNESTCLWEAPTLMPTDGKNYYWDEATVSWIEVQL